MLPHQLPAVLAAQAQAALQAQYHARILHAVGLAWTKAKRSAE